MIILGFVLVGALDLAVPPEDLQYERMVEVLKVQVSPSKEPRRHNLEITFNLLPDMPKGVKVFFELERDGTAQEDESGTPVFFPFLLENENRKSIKVVWTPKTRLTCDSYMLKTRIPLAEQSPEVQKLIRANTKRFPEKYDPWYWNHANQEFKVGTPEQAAAEYKEVQDFVEGKIAAILELNNDAMTELEKVSAGEAHVKAGKLAPESLRKSMTDWINRMTKVQKSIRDALHDDPGLYVTKYSQVHLNLVNFGKLVAKRISKVELKKVCDKYGVAISALKLPSPTGFEPNYMTGTSVAEIQRRQKALKRDLWYAEPGRKPEDIYKDPDEEAGDAAEESKDSKDGKTDEKGEAKEGEEASGKAAPKADEAKDAPAKPEPKKDAPGKKPSKKDSKKKK